jgi:hypothetical protein
VLLGSQFITQQGRGHVMSPCYSVITAELQEGLLHCHLIDTVGVAISSFAAAYLPLLFVCACLAVHAAAQVVEQLQQDQASNPQQFSTFHSQANGSCHHPSVMFIC